MSKQRLIVGIVGALFIALVLYAGWLVFRLKHPDAPWWTFLFE